MSLAVQGTLEWPENYVDTPRVIYGYTGYSGKGHTFSAIWSVVMTTPTPQNVSKADTSTGSVGKDLKNSNAAEEDGRRRNVEGGRRKRGRKKKERKGAVKKKINLRMYKKKSIDLKEKMPKRTFSFSLQF